MLFVYISLIFLGIKSVGNLILGAKTISPTPTPTVIISPTRTPTLTPKPSETEIFCGGIAGISCPQGYTCNLDGNYPDAGGKCITNIDLQTSGDAATEAECLAKGGRWGQWGLLPEEYCQIPSKDAGKSCTDGSECQYGLCMNREQRSPGVCASYRHEFGCYSIIRNGQPESTLCVD